jgi:hypothetical protein
LTPSEEPGRKEPRKGFAKVMGSSWSLAGTVVGAIAASVALLFTLFPGFIPDPKAVLAATMTIRTIEPHVTLGDYERRFQTKQRTADDEGGKDVGSLVYLRIKTQGKKHGHVRLDQVTYGWDTRNPIPIGSTVQALGFRPNTPNDEWIATAWVGDAQTGKDYFVRFELFDDVTMLDFVDTRRFHGVPDE